MATVEAVKAASVARRASKGRRGKRTRPEPGRYTVPIWSAHKTG